MSKNKRKSWKKINIEDVTQFHENNVLKEIHGDKFDKSNPSVPLLDFKIDRKSKAGPKTPKDFSSIHDRCLKSRSAVPALIAKQTNVKPPVSSDEEEDFIVKLRHKTSNTFPPSKSNNRIKPDIWAEKSRSDDNKKTVPHPTHHFSIPSIESGMSYNPDKDQYLSLLTRAAAVIQKDAAKKNKVTKFFDKKCALLKSKNEKAELIEMKYGLPLEFGGITNPLETQISENETNDENELIIKTIPNRFKMKSLKDRKRQILNKKTIETQKKLKTKKRVLKDINNINGVKKEIEKKHHSRLLTKTKIVERRIRKVKKIEEAKVDVPIQDIPLPTDISGNLRTIKPQGNFLLDRFNQLFETKLLVAGMQKKHKRKYVPKVKRSADVWNTICMNT